MYAGEQVAKQVKEPTLNDRLSKAADSLSFQCDRLESVLGRVNGTPPAPTPIRGDSSQVRPSHALTQVVEAMEQINQRLANLATGIENIA